LLSEKLTAPIFRIEMEATGSSKPFVYLYQKIQAIYVKRNIVAPALTILAVATTMHAVGVAELHVTVNYIRY
jgi:hypothetical protein